MRERKEVQKMLRKRSIALTNPDTKVSVSFNSDFSRGFLLFVFFFLFSSICFAADFVPGQIMVKFKPNVVTVKDQKGFDVYSLDKADIMSESIKALNAKHKVSGMKAFAKKERKLKKLRNGRVVELPDMSRIYLLQLPKDADVKSVVEEYKNDPAVEYAEPNYIMHIKTPDDPYYLAGNGSPDNDPNQWGLYKIGLTSIEGGNSGWNFCTGESSVKVAIIDTGSNYIHEDLKTRVDSLEGYNFAYANPDPMDDNGHGSHVSGIIGADSNNGKGVAGVDWHCRLIPIKSFDSGGSASDADIVSGLFWAVNNVSADVISMSFGGGPSSTIADAISYAATADCVLVAAAGNDNSSSPSYPAAYPHVISVAATDPYDHKASYSNFGSTVAVSAPGGDDGPGAQYYLHWILSTYDFHTTPDMDYTWLAGTSMATPFVSGLAALIIAEYPGISAEGVAHRITAYADNIDAYNPGYAGQLGSGRINALASLGGLYGYISYPANKGIVFGTVNVLGSATGETFSKYAVEYGIGLTPATWTTLETSTSSVLNGVLATFDSTGLDGNVSLRLILNDVVSQAKKIVFHVGSYDPPLIMGRPQYGPNPFNPNKENIMIKYDLDRNSEVYVYFFDLSGTQICRKYYAFAKDGGKQGTNRVYWDGKNDFGETVANGVYLFRIVSEDRTIGKGKIIVLK
jgi:thermitase